ncbi:hypothetical protein [Acidovorax carolinensis]|nr:hypothetical protein [Acidovorax carolinensis]
MQISVRVTRPELAEMETSEDRLKQGVINAMDRGLEDGDGTLYLAGFNVTVAAIDEDSEADMQSAFEAKYQRDWNDPAGDEMKAVWADAWAAAKASA